MRIDNTRQDARRQRAEALQGRLLGGVADLPRDARALFTEIRRHLVRASDAGRLRDPPEHVFRWAKLTDAPAHGPAAHAIVGGEKNFARTRDKAHFTRSDGAWFDFSLTIRERHGEPVELVAYNFEMRFPDQTTPAWLRLDLNPPGHGNEAGGHRAHLHPAADDLTLPYAALHPIETLDMFVYELRRRDPLARRQT